MGGGRARRLHYLAYGSNLWQPRLAARVPSARVVGAVALAGWELRFHKRGWKDGSAKCNIVRRSGATAYGVVYRMDRGDRASLDAAEGLGNGYRRHRMEVRLGQEDLTVFTYVAQDSHVDESLRPYGWYLELVVAGAREHGLPATYVDRLLEVPTLLDPDRRRAANERGLLAAGCGPG